MKKVMLLLAVLTGLLVMRGGSVLAQGTTTGSQNIGIVTLNEQNGSGENGSATLSQGNGQLTITIEVDNGTSTPQPAHIHNGTCANLDPTPLYPLNPVVNGKSVTTLSNVTLGDLMGGTYAINVHKSAAEARVYVACGDLTNMARAGGTNPGAVGGGGGPVGMPATGTPFDATLPLLLITLALGFVFTGVKLARRAR